MGLIKEMIRIAKKEKLTQEERMGLVLSNTEQLTIKDVLTLVTLQVIYHNFYNDVVYCVDRAEDEFFD